MQLDGRMCAWGALGLAIIALGCSQPKGACVRGTGVTQSCGNDFTSGSCNFIGGNKFYEGLTCEDLGFSPTPAAVSGSG
jgi:hypothetical protein